MEQSLAEMMSMVQMCECGNHHNPIPIEKIVIEAGAIAGIAPFLKEKSFYKVAILADENTIKAVGDPLLSQLIDANITHAVVLIQPDENHDVVADEKSLVQAMLEIPQETDVVISVGAGTLHDISRFCSTKLKIPFISVPTAPSVDGFTSLGAPLIVRGVKKTFQMTSPLAVFADLEVLQKAPQNMIAAGFGDMLAKFTSLADWQFGHLVAGEPYCPAVSQITREALESTVANVDTIAHGDEAGIRILTESLIKSGLAMLIFGQSHPASGGEHHLSHYWEMEFLKQNRPAVLHGAKVGVSTALLADIYKHDLLRVIKNETALQAKLPEIICLYESIPETAQLREWLKKVGGETLSEQLGIDEDLLKRSLAEAHHLRDRFTGLKFLNEVANVHHS